MIGTGWREARADLFRQADRLCPGALSHPVLISGRPTSERRILIASAGFSLFVAALGAFLRFVLGDALRAAL
jgi:hypothetical protein